MSSNDDDDDDDDCFTSQQLVVLGFFFISDRCPCICTRYDRSMKPYRPQDTEN